MHRRTLLAAGLAAPFARAHAQAAWAPNRPIRFIVPFVAGGSTDVAAAATALLAAWPAAAGPLAERLRERWQAGQAEATSEQVVAVAVFGGALLGEHGPGLLR